MGTQERFLLQDVGTHGGFSTVSSGSSKKSGNSANTSMDHLYDVTVLLREGRSVLVCSDVNICHRAIDIHNPKGNAKFGCEERAWADRWLEQGWWTLTRPQSRCAGLYSWWSNRGRAEKGSRWRIDYLLADRCLRDAPQTWIESMRAVGSCSMLVRFEGNSASSGSSREMHAVRSATAMFGETPEVLGGCPR